MCCCTETAHEASSVIPSSHNAALREWVTTHPHFSDQHAHKSVGRPRPGFMRTAMRMWPRYRHLHISEGPTALTQQQRQCLCGFDCACSCILLSLRPPQPDWLRKFGNITCRTTVHGLSCAQFAVDSHASKCVRCSPLHPCSVHGTTHASHLLTPGVIQGLA